MMLLALKIALVIAVSGLLVFIGDYHRMTRGACWRDPVGQTIIIAEVFLLGTLAPLLAASFFTLTPAETVILSWVLIGFLAAGGLAMYWRTLVFEVIHRRGKRDGLGLPLLPVLRVIAPDGGDNADGRARPRELALRAASGLDVPHLLGRVPLHDRPLRRDLAQHAGRVARPHAAVKLILHVRGPPRLVIVPLAPRGKLNAFPHLSFGHVLLVPGVPAFRSLRRCLVLIQPRRDEHAQLFHILIISLHRPEAPRTWSGGLPHIRIRGDSGETTVNIGKYSKLIAAVVGLALTVLSQKYANTDWLPYVVAVAGALGVYGVPNSGAKAPAATVTYPVTQPSAPAVPPAEKPAP